TGLRALAKPNMLSSGWQESNLRHLLPRQALYHFTTSSQRVSRTRVRLVTSSNLPCSALLCKSSAGTPRSSAEGSTLTADQLLALLARSGSSDEDIFLGHALSPASTVYLPQSGEVTELVSDLRVTLRRLVTTDACGSKLARVLLVEGQSTLKCLSSDRRSSGALLKDRKSPVCIQEVGGQLCIRQTHLLQGCLVCRVGERSRLRRQIHARLKLRWTHVTGDPGGEVIVAIVEADRKTGLPHDLTVRVLHGDVPGRREARRSEE